MRHLLGLFLIALVSTGGPADMAVVVGKDSGIRQLDRSEVAAIFLGKTNRFADGALARPVELDDENVRRRFYRDVAGKSLSQINSYWTALIFTGKGRPPKTIVDPGQLIDLLNIDRQAIGYLPLDQVTDGLHVVYVARGERAEP